MDSFFGGRGRGQTRKENLHCNAKKSINTYLRIPLHTLWSLPCGVEDDSILFSTRLDTFDSLAINSQVLSYSEVNFNKPMFELI